MMQLINPRRRMKESLVFLVFAVAGSCAGIFWTDSKNNDYPRIGRRSFYTGSDENTFPRIGRGGGGVSEDYSTYDRRAFFTQSDENTFPRIGRQSYNKPSGEALKAKTATDSPFPSSQEAALSLTKSHSGLDSTFSLPAPILFYAWDVNGDDSLSREELVNGIANARKRRRLM